MEDENPPLILEVRLVRPPDWVAAIEDDFFKAELIDIDQVIEETWFVYVESKPKELICRALFDVRGAVRYLVYERLRISAILPPWSGGFNPVDSSAVEDPIRGV